ncbi:hypothetical protein EC991_001748 [Linnemannia zychae]|nr:hypothetical protein EC991_001748 [Linnemannia zychae]
MLSYLAVNQSQTGTWDRILLDEPEAYDPIRSYLFISVESSSAPAFNPPERPVLQNMWLKGLLEMDPITKTWIISPWKWILAFGVIFASQCACWYYGLLAFDREARDRKAKGGNYSSGHDHSSRLVASEQA